MMTYLFKIRNYFTDKLGWLFCEISFKMYAKTNLEMIPGFFYNAGVWFYSLYKDLKNNDMKEVNEGFYNWVFHLNPYTGLWCIIHREDYTNYWSGGETKYPIVKSRDINTLIYVINTSNGDPNTIESVIDLAVTE